MRRFDKNKQIKKANILAEQRHLLNKGLINETELNEYDDDYETTSRGIQYGINPYQDQSEIPKENTYKVEVIGKEADKDGGAKHRWVYEINAYDEKDAEEMAADKFNKAFLLSDIYLYSVKVIQNPTDKDIVQTRGVKFY